MMRTHKKVYFLTSLIMTSFIMSSCTDHSTAENENLVILSGSSGSLKWEMEYPEKIYYFSDLLPLSFRLTSGEEDLTVSLNPDASIPWGDFRVYSSSYSDGRLKLRLQPVKAGQSFLRIPAFPLVSDSIAEMKPVEIEIKSFLEETSGEVSPLMDVQDQADRLPLWFILLISVSVPAVTIFLIRHFSRKKPEKVKEESLSGFIAGIEGRSYGESEMIDLYKKFYRLLLKELLLIHPSVLQSDGPAELIAHLEMPSPLNQWALRSLYPLLEAMDAHFFHKNPEGRLEDRFKGDLDILKEWIGFAESLEKEEERKK